MAFSQDVVVLGGCGHVGLPLGIVLADRGYAVTLFDLNEAAVARVNSGDMPFDEPGAPEVLKKVLDDGALVASADPGVISTAQTIVVVIGTPVDDHLNPDLFAVPNAIEAIESHLRDGQLMVLRSTVYPGVTGLVEKLIAKLGKRIDVAFCPERIAEGKAMVELSALPQIVSSRTDQGYDRAAKLFDPVAVSLVRMHPEEAELAKLFTNSYRYIKFAIANQFFMIANEYGLDFDRIRAGLTEDYPRAADLPGAGFAAGPCLFKDTMQLAAFNNNNFTLGHSAMLVNEGLPLYLVSRADELHGLADMRVGILGMSFKACSDDRRASLSYKLKRILRFRAREVRCTDPYVTDDPSLLPLDQVLAESDILFLATPHPEYLDLATELPVIDVWNHLGRGSVI